MTSTKILKTPTSAWDQLKVIVFRGMCARCNYLAPGRPDILHPHKELCRELRAQTSGSVVPGDECSDIPLRRPAVLKLKSKLIWELACQPPYEVVDVSAAAIDASTTAKRGACTWSTQFTFVRGIVIGRDMKHV